jgi:ribosomal protein S18 acetylase RimI-like enzyme
MIAVATPADAGAMAQVLGDWIGVTAWMPKLHTPAENIWFCDHLIKTCEVWVIRTPDVAGFIARQGTEVPALYVAVAARGRGQGKSLLDRAKVDRDSLDLWTFQANARAIAFYLREGFTEIRRTTGEGNDEKLPDLRLRWTRKPQS